MHGDPIDLGASRGEPSHPRTHLAGPAVDAAERERARPFPPARAATEHASETRASADAEA